MDGIVRAPSNFWFNHSSNAARSGSPQDQADGRLWYWAKDGSSTGYFDSNGNGWDKSSDMNLQVYAHKLGKDDCKKDGWQALSRVDGSGFKNQGDCIQYVNTGK